MSEADMYPPGSPEKHRAICREYMRRKRKALPKAVQREKNKRQREARKLRDPDCRKREVRKLTNRFATAKHKALVRGLIWDLTFEQYAAFVSVPCIYCDGFFPQVIAGCGLDRLDNKGGYTPTNVGSCCLHCNRIKMHDHTPEETRVMVQALIQLRRPKLHVVS